MLTSLFFWLGVVNNLALLAVFILRRWKFSVLEKYGWTYLLLAAPTVYGIFLAIQQPGAVQYLIFLLIFLGFLTIEALYDWVWKLPFREQLDWRTLVPYVLLYLSSSYGFVAMTWRNSSAQGIVMLTLFVVQIGANIATHPRQTTRPSESSTP